MVLVYSIIIEVSYELGDTNGILTIEAQPQILYLKFKSVLYYSPPS